MPNRNRGNTKENVRRYQKSAHGRAMVLAGQNRRHARKRMILNDIKLIAGCIDCGYDHHPSALDFDHKSLGTKSFTFAQLHSKSLKRIFEEVMKCDVRCANCHRIRHFA